MGGWRIVKTVGRGIYRLRPLDGLVSQGGSAVVIFAAAAVDAPVSITHVVSASVRGSKKSAAYAEQRFYAARSYSFIRPPRIGRRLIRCWLRSATG